MTDAARKRRGCSPLTVVGCGCGFAAMLGIAFIFFTLGVLYVRERQDPRWNAAAYHQCQMNLRNLGRAIDSYRADHRQLPDNLAQLREYMATPDWLRCPMQARNHGEAYRYLPAPAQPLDPLITCTNHPQGPVTLLHNGRLRLSDAALRGDSWKKHPLPPEGAP